MRGWLVPVAVACLMAGCAGAPSGSGGPPVDTTVATSQTPPTAVNQPSFFVTLKDSAFQPGSLSIAKHSRIQFTNNDSTTAHTVTISPQGSTAGTFLHDGQVPPAGGATSYDFPDPGTYDIWCRYHGSRGNGMHMTVVVTGEPASRAPTGPVNATLSDNRYDPLSLDVKAFQDVTFTNKGTTDHTVTIAQQGTATGSTVRDKDLQPGAQESYNFPSAGTYDIWCKWHGARGSGMHMTITVT